MLMTRLFRQSFCPQHVLLKGVCEHRVGKIVADSGSCMPQERAGEDVTKSKSSLNLMREGVGGLNIGLLPDVAPRRAARIACDHAAGRIVEGIVGIGQPP